MRRVDTDKLRQAREDMGLSQLDLAYLVRCAVGTIVNWETGRTKISANDLMAVAMATTKPIDYFFEWVDLEPADAQAEAEAEAVVRSLGGEAA